jgi:hypothetical protein
MHVNLPRILFMLVAICRSMASSTSPAGMLYPNESVYLNGTEIDHSNPVSAGDVIRTKERGAATLHLARSIALIPPDSVIRLEGQSLAIDTGTISLSAGNGVRPVLPTGVNLDPTGHQRIAVYARDFKMTPANADLTEFDVMRSNGLIAISARKNAVLVSCGAHSFNVGEGSQLSRVDKSDCGSTKK